MLPLVSRLLDRGLASGVRKAALVDAVGAALQHHTAVLVAAHADRETRGRIDSALNLAALDDETYTNVLCCAQLATAQLKLRRHCPAFWQQLERRGMQHLEARQLATIVHRAAALREQIGAPPPSAALWGAMEAAIAMHASDMDPQQVSSCLSACAKLEHRPRAVAMKSLLSAAEDTSTSMAAQEVAMALWALAKLGVRVQGKLRGALMAAALRNSADMNAQAVSNTLHALAGLRRAPPQELTDALMVAIVRERHNLTAQAVCTVLDALAKLRLRTPPPACDALLEATLRMSAQQMNMIEVSSALSALTALQWQLSDELQRALCAAVARTSPQMNAQAVAVTLMALARLWHPPSAAAQRALSAALDREAKHLTPQGADMIYHALTQLCWPVLHTTRARIDAKRTLHT